MRKIILFFRAIAIGFFTLLGSGFVMGQVIISQYIETSSGSYPKGIEVWNVSGSEIDFATTNLEVYQGTNGATPVSVLVINTGTLAAGSVIVIGTAQDVLTATGFQDYVISNGAAFYPKAFVFNGDDALVLYLNGVVTDVFGNPGSDPGTGWVGNGVQTYNQNISIKSGIHTGDTDGWTDPSQRFEITSTDNSLTGFGIAPVSPSTPTITVNPSTLTNFYYDYGNGPSSDQSFTVSGTDLTADISIAPPADYEISSETGGSFSATNPIVLNQSGGIVESTTIYTRLKAGLAFGDYSNEDITASSADADNKTVTCSGSVGVQIGWANLQWPYDGTIDFGGDYTVYAQVYVAGITDAAGQGEYITSWIGYNTTNTDPATWENWVLATYNVDVGNNDEYMANIGPIINAPGTFYYASRFQMGSGDYVYGGYNGGFWDGSTNVSGMLTVNSGVNSPIIINEVDADTPGTDTAEFIELYDGGAGNTSLDGLVLVLYNGGTDASYAAYDLDTYSTNGSGYFVVGNVGVTNVDITFADNFLQNGADAVALYFGNASDFPNGTVVRTTNLIDAFVYDTDDADDPGLLVLLNASEPQVNENGRGSKDLQSSQRFPNGTGGARNTSTYDQTYPTPGAANKGNATWTGSANNDWEAIVNWAYVVPTADHDVYIPSGLGNYPTISSSATCNNITIQDGASLIGTEYLTVGGTATMQRSIPAYSTAADGWHLLSSPVATFNIAGSDFQPGTVSPNLDDFYGWDESTYTWINYKNGNPLQMVPGRGYLVAYQTTATKDFVGTFNSADIPLTNLSKTIAGNGWNLLGNPFQSALEWNTANWGISNISSGAKVLTSGGSYADILDGGIIPANQGFFVQALDASNSITIPASQRVHSATAFYKSEPANRLNLKASDGDFYVETSIQIMDGATLGFDAAYDMNFLAGMQNAPFLYSAIGETEKLSTNRIAPVDALTEVPLAFKSFSDKEYTLSTTNANSFDNDIEVYLMDKVADMRINLKEIPEYTFTATAGELTDRFVVQLFKVGTSTQDAELVGVHIYSNGEQIYLQSNSDNKALVRVFNMLGQEVYNKTMVIGGLQSIDIKQKAGWYIVQLAGEQGIVREKVFIR